MSCYLIEGEGGLLAFDAGWPGSLREYRDALKGAGRRLDEIRWLLVSHFHIDHAGLAGEFQSRGALFVSFPSQAGSIGEMEELIARKGYPYLPVDRDRLRVIPLGESRAWLASLGVSGEVIRTDGHADQCVSLLLDSGTAFTGDLAPEAMLGDSDERSLRNWAELRARGIRHVCPAHGPEYDL